MGEAYDPAGVVRDLLQELLDKRLWHRKLRSLIESKKG